MQCNEFNSRRGDIFWLLMLLIADSWVPPDQFPAASQLFQRDKNQQMWLKGKISLDKIVLL